MDLALDDLEAARDSAGPVADYAVEMRANTPVHDLSLSPDEAVALAPARGAELSLDGTWLLRGIDAEPGDFGEAPHGVVMGARR